MKRLLVVLSLGCVVSAASAQMLAEQEASMNMSNTLSAGPVGPSIPAGLPGAGAGLGNTAAGFQPVPTIGLPGLPGQPAAAAPAFPGLGGASALPPEPGQPGAVQATPTPEPTIKVLVGKRVFDAVTGALLEDPVQISVPARDKDKYLDDGQHDNGIKDDGVRGDVVTIKDKYIGAETNSIKNRLINLVRNAEELDPMVFFGYHFAAVDPTTQHRNMPNYLVKEAQRDDSLRDWNNKFLADYRIDKNDPRSEFYQLYVPEPPMYPTGFPPPPGYIAPQKMEPGQTPGPGVVQPTPNIYNGDPVIDVPI